MSLRNILDSEGPVLSVTVAIINKIDEKLFIVEDQDSICLLNTTKSNHQVEVGKQYKLIKPVKSSQDMIEVSPKFRPQNIKVQVKWEAKNKTKQKQEIERLMKIAKKTPLKDSDSKRTTLKEIDQQINLYTKEILIYAVNVSKKIQGKFGPYQICGFKDVENVEGALNLYGKYVNQMSQNYVYVVTNIKKIYIEKDGEKKLRLATTGCTKI